MRKQTSKTGGLKMGIFSRLRDIINSNINAMLDRAEDPEKLVKLMIQEMEDTLVEIKASCAGTIASKKKSQRLLDEAQAQAAKWEENAKRAIDKGREGLAREALKEKRSYTERVAGLETELTGLDSLLEEYRKDIEQLEAKLAVAREKQRVLIQRHIHAQKKKRAQDDIRRFDTSDALIRFEQFENRIERMEAEADLVNYGRKGTADERFADLEDDDEIESELKALKESAKPEEEQS